MAKEGLPIFILFALFTGILLVIFLRTGHTLPFACMVLFSIISIFILFFFRDPERKIPDGQGLLVSPADGRVIDISEIDDPYIGGKAIRVSIFLNVFNVHINRAPAAGKVELVRYYPGKFLAAWDHKASLDNEQSHVGFNCGAYKLLVKQIAGLIARRVVCRVREGDACERGGRFGLIKFGSRTDLHMPATFKVRVKKGDKVKGGASVIASAE